MVSHAAVTIDDLRKSKGLHSVSAYGHGQYENTVKLSSPVISGNHLFKNGHAALYNYGSVSFGDHTRTLSVQESPDPDSRD